MLCVGGGGSDGLGGVVVGADEGNAGDGGCLEMEGVDCVDGVGVVGGVAADGVVEDEGWKGGEVLVEEAGEVREADLLGVEDLGSNGAC